MIMRKISAFYHENKHETLKIYVYDHISGIKVGVNVMQSMNLYVCVFVHYITF